MTVALILIDGLRPDALEPARCPRLKALRASAAATMAATSIMPSMTLPAHTSIFHSVPPERHGITSNVWRPMARPLPGLFDVASAAGLRCASFTNWEQLRDLGRPGSLAFAFYDDTDEQPDGDLAIAQAAAGALGSGEFDFAFVYFGSVDVAGHNHGWMSAPYLEQVGRADDALGAVLDALPDGSSVVVQSDHGGHGRDHGTDRPEDMTIPWLVDGPQIKHGYTIDVPVSLLDTAPTIARLLNVPPHRQWEGRCVDEAFAG